MTCVWWLEYGTGYLYRDTEPTETWYSHFVNECCKERAARGRFREVWCVWWLVRTATYMYNHTEPTETWHSHFVNDD